MTDAPELFAYTKKQIADGKRLTKSDMAYCIHHADHWNSVGMYPEYYKRDEIVDEFNRIFETNIK